MNTMYVDVASNDWLREQNKKILQYCGYQLNNIDNVNACNARYCYCIRWLLKS